MMDDVKIIAMIKSDLGKVQMFCGHSPAYQHGYDAKMKWLRGRLAEGMRYTLLQVNGYNAGFIEYIPGEYAWRGIEAKGYLFIHCFWVIGRNRGHGYGRHAARNLPGGCRVGRMAWRWWSASPTGCPPRSSS